MISDITISTPPTPARVGTGATFPCTATVNNPGCDNNVATNNCLVVTWSVPTTTCASTTPNCEGTIDPNTGIYTAPGTAITAVTITATSVKDTTVTATATATVVTAVDPTLTSVSPNTAEVGSLFQDVYITGTNFIATITVSSTRDT